MKLFDFRIDEIIQQVDRALIEKKKIFQEKLKYFFLIGEFSESPYLQYKLKNYYEKKNIILVTPRVPTLAIAKGAPQLGLVPFTSCPLHRIFHTASSMHNVVTVLQDVEEWMKPTIANAKKFRALTGKPLVKALTDKELAKIEQDSKEQMVQEIDIIIGVEMKQEQIPPEYIVSDFCKLFDLKPDQFQIKSLKKGFVNIK
ncbi:hypothetical protein RFI_28788 [Reticulomyxa filosa]|uniref:Uncharacterized protein n=1 Tax=Reticulomyxa filosa TaxID=46433 RepID=X6M3P7_RETFI|nr:hypothetical protein RFI_28788 [Reticulomyxa filosa]|eukprot:ETO08598.1 hypothetical protein RFI_28788 [Reticulomyxa filosa]